jgi:beta-N-acetylhexosaminidase
VTKEAYPDAGPLIMVDLPGPELDDAWRDHLLRHDIRAVCLFGRNAASSAQAQRLVAELRELIGPGAIIAIDQEGGGVVRTRDLPFPPSAMSLGASQDPELAFRVGAATARGLRALGVNWNFAPVLDVSNNPRNPVIGDRSFGGDPEAVASLALAWARGSEGEGVASCVKHFPGHGDTHLDSHLSLPTVDKPMDELAELEFRPFKRAVAAGVPAFMTAHIVYLALGGERPATLSRAILTKLLRQDWGYDGVIITDSMGMKAVSDNFGRGEAAVMALEAGADMVMALGSREAQEETLAAIALARQGGRLDGAATRRSLERLEGFAARFPARAVAYSAEAREADEALMAEAWRRGLSLYGEPRRPAPNAPVLLLVARETPGENVSEGGLPGPALAAQLAAGFALTAVHYHRADPLAALAELRVARREGQTVVFASTSRHRLTDEQKALVREAKPDLHLALWNPYAACDVDAPALLSYGFRPEALAAVVAWLLGREEASGRLPVSLDA